MIAENGAGFVFTMDTFLSWSSQVNWIDEIP